MANAGQQPLPVSKLPAITAAQISDDDLLLVTDIDGGSKTSRKMTMKQLANYVMNRLAADPSKLKPYIDQEAAKVFNNNIENGVISTVRNKSDVVEDLLDGVEDSQFLIDGGNANAEVQEED